MDLSAHKTYRLLRAAGAFSIQMTYYFNWTSLQAVSDNRPEVKHVLVQFPHLLQDRFISMKSCKYSNYYYFYRNNDEMIITSLKNASIMKANRKQLKTLVQFYHFYLLLKCFVKKSFIFANTKETILLTFNDQILFPL